MQHPKGNESVEFNRRLINTNNSDEESDLIMSKKSQTYNSDQSSSKHSHSSMKLRGSKCFRMKSKLRKLNEILAKKDEELELQEEKVSYERESLRESEAMIRQQDIKIKLLDSAIGCSEREHQKIINKRDAANAAKDNKTKQLQDRLARLKGMMASNSESEESRQTVQTIGDSSEESEEEETTPKPSDSSPTGKVRQMANEGFEVLDNALEEIESIGREENNVMKVNEST